MTCSIPITRVRRLVAAPSKQPLPVFKHVECTLGPDHRFVDMDLSHSRCWQRVRCVAGLLHISMLKLKFAKLFPSFCHACTWGFSFLLSIEAWSLPALFLSVLWVEPKTPLIIKAPTLLSSSIDWASQKSVFVSKDQAKAERELALKICGWARSASGTCQSSPMVQAL